MFNRHNSPDRSNIFFVFAHDLRTSFIETMSPLARITSSSMLETDDNHPLRPQRHYHVQQYVVALFDYLSSLYLIRVLVDHHFACHCAHKLDKVKQQQQWTIARTSTMVWNSRVLLHLLGFWTSRLLAVMKTRKMILLIF
jgi:hypothetical protein